MAKAKAKQQFEHGVFCDDCKALDLVPVASSPRGPDDGDGEVVVMPDRCRMCGSDRVRHYELPPKPARKRHEEAYRLRAGEVGVLLSCICTYPLDKHETVSGHDMRCPSEAMTRKLIDMAEAKAAQLEEPEVTKRESDGAYVVGPPPDSRGVDEHLQDLIDGERGECDEDLPPWERKR